MMSKLFEFSMFFLSRSNQFFRLNSEWELGYHPFPEMSRFLNPYSRIHYQSSKRTSNSRPTHSLLEYICR